MAKEVFVETDTIEVFEEVEAVEVVEEVSRDLTQEERDMSLTRLGTRARLIGFMLKMHGNANLHSRVR